MRERGTTKLLGVLVAALALAGIVAGCGGDGDQTQKGSEELTAPTEKTQMVEETTAPRERTAEETTAPERNAEAATEAAAEPEPVPDESAAVAVPEPAPETVPPVPAAPSAPVAPEPEPQAPPPSGITPEQAENRRILVEREATYDGTGPSPWVQGQIDEARKQGLIP